MYKIIIIWIINSILKYGGKVMKVEKQKYKEFYNKYHDIKISAFEICDKKLKKSRKHSKLLNYYHNSSITLGSNKIYVTYVFPTQDVKMGFTIPAHLVMTETVEGYLIDEIETYIFE